MIVTIIKKGQYSGPNGKRIVCSVGERLECVSWYGESLVDSGFAVEGEMGEAQAASFDTIDDLMTELATEPETRPDIELFDDVNATDSAIIYASQNGIDLSGVEGTGKDGRITLADVKKAN